MNILILSVPKKNLLRPWIIKSVSMECGVIPERELAVISLL